MPQTVKTDHIELNAASATPVMLANKKQITYLRIGLTGCNLHSRTKVPINVALVIDKSASMQGEKIHHAKAAATIAVNQLEQDDVLAIVAYDHHANILLPAIATKETTTITAAINQLSASGQTALFNGIETGAKEIRKFWHRNQVNRLILLSDGIANVGPNSPEELGQLGTALSQENIAITTIGLGLGYNEDLMTQLARNSDGNHAFVEQGAQLSTIFAQEFKDICSVIAQEVNVTIICMEGVRPLRVLGRSAQIQGSTVSVKLNQLYSEQEKYVLLELEIPPFKSKQVVVIAGIAVVYRNMNTQLTERLSCKMTITFTHSLRLVEQNQDFMVMATVAEQLAVEKNKLAVKLRDEGKVKEAQQLLFANATCLAEEAAQYQSTTLHQLHKNNLIAAHHLDDTNWQRQRKLMRQHQYQLENQQRY